MRQAEKRRKKILILSRARGEFPDEMACDLAEVYRILDADALRPSLLATLVAGLPEESRLMRAVSGRRASQRDMLLAAVVDRLSTLVWFQTTDGVKGRNRPKSVLERLLREDEQEKGVYSVPPEKLEDAIRRIRES